MIPLELRGGMQRSFVVEESSITGVTASGFFLRASTKGRFYPEATMDHFSDHFSGPMGC